MVNVSLVPFCDKERVDHVSNLTPLDLNLFITMGQGNVLGSATIF